MFTKNELLNIIGGLKEVEVKVKDASIMIGIINKAYSMIRDIDQGEALAQQLQTTPVTPPVMNEEPKQKVKKK